MYRAETRLYENSVTTLTPPTTNILLGICPELGLLIAITPLLSGAYVTVVGCRISSLIVVYLWDIRGSWKPMVKDLGFESNEYVASTRIIDDQILGMTEKRLVFILLYSPDFRRGQN